ncbi:unnamed protein product [Soboliphyme baturini]|uniref:Protein kinase domain-containing protein n=1 Tax=Soboliphyme baturini TaxID=241478 RepID=A0A183J414_9BILA|nr:unnamed protein product [Soboliphyme baturini]
MWRLDANQPRVGEILQSKWQLQEPVKQGEHRSTEVIGGIEALLSQDMNVIKALMKHRSSHVLQLQGLGRRQKRYKWMATELGGTSLMRLQKTLPGQRFSTRTALFLAYMTLEAIEHVHKVGYGSSDVFLYVHRNITPGHFLIGKPPFVRRLYIVSFCNARKYWGSDDKHLPERRRIAFKSTQRYASPNALRLKDQSRRDDLISWFFMVVEFFNGCLPWTTEEVDFRKPVFAVQYEQMLKVMAEEREKFISVELTQLIGGAPVQLYSIINYLTTLKFDDNPCYAVLRNLLFEACCERVQDHAQILDYETPEMVEARQLQPSVEETFTSRSLSTSPSILDLFEKEETGNDGAGAQLHSERNEGKKHMGAKSKKQ